MAKKIKPINTNNTNINNTAKFNFLNILKSPLFWISLAVIGAIIFLIVMTNIQSKPSCDLSKNDFDPKYGCIPKCQGSLERCGKGCYDKTKQICVNNMYPCTSCNGSCCDGDCLDNPTKPGTKICCSQEQLCTKNGNTTCCGGGTICKDGECVAICGPDGSKNTCNPNEICFETDNVGKDSILYNNLKNSNPKPIEEDKGNYSNFYSCLNQDKKCLTSNQPFFEPPIISKSNFTPYFNIQKKDTDTGLGFCTASNIENQADIDECKKNDSKETCKDIKCEWYDVLKDGINTDTDKTKLNDLNTAISKTFKINDGIYCGPSGQRVFGLNLDKSTCNPIDCLEHVANPLITDIYYDTNTGGCTALMDGKKMGITNYRVTVDNNTRKKDPFITPVGFNIKDTVNFNKNFGDFISFNKEYNQFVLNDCDVPDVCKNATDNSDEQCLDDGTLYRNGEFCKNGGKYNPAIKKCICPSQKDSDGNLYYLFGGSDCSSTTDKYCNDKAIGFVNNDKISTSDPTCICNDNYDFNSNCKDVITVKNIVTNSGQPYTDDGIRNYAKSICNLIGSDQSGVLIYIIGISPNITFSNIISKDGSFLGTGIAYSICDKNVTDRTDITNRTDIKVNKFSYVHSEYGNPNVNFDLYYNNNLIKTCQLFMPGGQKEYNQNILPVNSYVASGLNVNQVGYSICLIGTD